MTDTLPAATERSRGRRMLLFMLCLFLLPVLVVLAMHALEWRPAGTSYGTLVTPPRRLPLDAASADGAAQWQRHWNLVHVSRDGCPPGCQAELHAQRQVHVSLNKESSRLQRFLLIAGPLPAPLRQQLTQRYPDLIILEGEAAAALLPQFAVRDMPAAHTFLVDPLGNLMMAYPPALDPKGLRKDLMRLLKYSWIG